MSRIGLQPITLPQGVTFKMNGTVAEVTGKLGTLTFEIPEGITATVDGSEIYFARNSDKRQTKMLHGTTRSIIENLVLGVSEGFTKELELVGVGYRAALQGNTISLSIGFKHQVTVDIPNDLKVEVPSQTAIKIFGIDKQKVGQFAASVRALRPPEPYKGKGIRYLGEYVKKKEVKTSVS
ncbi:MAG: 50S ribosomal protein L6 [Candidatus Dojkabacteria bacterium]|nr:MAG: 50S ribosomal protein L6 [Candidatus Dojkabacteria bacterium]